WDRVRFSPGTDEKTKVFQDDPPTPVAASLYHRHVSQRGSANTTNVAIHQKVGVWPLAKVMIVSSRAWYRATASTSPQTNALGQFLYGSGVTTNTAANRHAHVNALYA